MDEGEQTVQEDCFADLLVVQGSSAENRQVVPVADLVREEHSVEVAGGEDHCGDPKMAAELAEYCSVSFAGLEQLQWAQAD